MENDSSGVALVICAPSGAGKSTLIKQLVQHAVSFAYSISCTTRKPRAREKDGREYYFLSKEEFKKRIEQGYFAEWAKVHGNYYGTPLQETLELLKQGRDIVFDIDVQGARQLRETLGTRGVNIFIFPPGKKELKSRLKKRKSESLEDLEKRLEAAKLEIEAAFEFDYWVYNQDLDKASQDLNSIYFAEKLKPGRNKALLQRVLDSWLVE